jgi:hypothetical protein
MSRRSRGFVEGKRHHCLKIGGLQRETIRFDYRKLFSVFSVMVFLEYVLRTSA